MDELWYQRTAGARLARAALRPAELLFRAAVGVRGLLYESGVLPVAEAQLPCVSIGNLTVGGTGKTPVAAWFAGELERQGVRPAIVLRGYGGDEEQVHRLLNPSVPVVAAADRAAGVWRAAALGADAIILDDAFQHRRLTRTADLVLVSADRWRGRVRLLPAGPFREPMGALRRATMVLVTTKASPAAAVETTIAAVRAAAPGVPIGVARLALDAVHAGLDGRAESLPLKDLRGMQVLAIAGIGDPDAFFHQLSLAGAEVRGAVFRDHHAFSEGDIAAIAREAAGSACAVCTLKDAVKLHPRWPPNAPPLRWVSQRVIIERGGEALNEVIALLRAPARITQPADESPPTPR